MKDWNYLIFQEVIFIMSSIDYKIIKKIIKNDIKSKKFINPISMINMWLHGFSIEKYKLYNFKVNKKDYYLSDLSRLKAQFINAPYQPILDNKIIFEQVFSKHITVPKNYALIKNGKIYPLKKMFPVDNIAVLLEFCSKGNGLVIKPVIGGGGKSIVFLKVINEKLYLNNEIVNKTFLEKYISNLDNFIITEFIKQGKYSQSLCPCSTNTIRIIAMVDPNNQKPFIAAAVQRIGSSKSNGVDNFSKYGCSAYVNLNTGELSAAVSKTETGKLIWYNKHPESNHQIKGIRVYMWEEIKQKILSVMDAIPYIKYVGWDIAITDNDIVFIEGNNHPNPMGIQIHKPILTNKKIRDFYRNYKIL